MYFSESYEYVMAYHGLIPIHVNGTNFPSLIDPTNTIMFNFTTDGIDVMITYATINTKIYKKIGSIKMNQVVYTHDLGYEKIDKIMKEFKNYDEYLPRTIVMDGLEYYIKRYIR